MTENNLKLAVFSYDEENSSYKISSYLERPIYVEYERQYDELDAAKVVVELSAQNSQALQKNNLLWIEGDACMLIDTVKGYSDNKIDAWGSLCDGFLKRRQIFENQTFETQPLSVVFSTLFAAVTPIPGMTFTTRNLPTDITYTGTLEAGNLFDIIQNLCKRLELGFKVEKTVGDNPNELLLQLVIYAGEDKSETVEMSQFYETISDFEYTDNSKDEVNFVRVNGADDIYETIEIQGLTNATKIEALLDCTNIEKGEMTEQEYRAVLHEKGQKYLEEHQSKLSYSGSYTGYTFKLDEDFNIGDIVSIKDEKRSLDIPKRITGALKQIDLNGATIQLNYGDVQVSLPALIDKIYKKVDTSEVIVVNQGTSGKPTKFIPSTSAPTLTPHEGDFIAILNETTVTSLKRLQNGSWNDVEFVSVYQSSPPTPVLNTYCCMVTQTSDSNYDISYVLSCPPPGAPAGTLAWGSAYPGNNQLFMDSAPSSPQADIGDYWIKTIKKSAVESYNTDAFEAYLATKSGWQLQWKFNQVGRKSANSLAEIFGDYRDATVSSGTVTGGNYSNVPYDNISGYENHSLTSNATTTHSRTNRVGGEYNDLKDCILVDEFGNNNQITTLERGFVRGNNNTIERCKNVKLIGDSNQITQTKDRIIIGGYNQIQESTDYAYSNVTLLGGGNTAEWERLRVGILPWVDVIIGHNAQFKKDVYSEAPQGTLLCATGTYYTFLVDLNGGIHALGSYSSDLGADYAEYFEWLDGNPENEDRRGLLVNINAADALDEYDPDCEKIYLADGDDFIGAVSATPAIIGDSKELEWKRAYKTDIFGTALHDKDGNLIPTEEYVSNKKYEPRSLRKEWSPVGLMGKLIVVDNGKCKPNDYIQAQNGVAIPCDHETKAKMMRRIDAHHIRILIL